MFPTAMSDAGQSCNSPSPNRCQSLCIDTLPKCHLNCDQERHENAEASELVNQPEVGLSCLRRKLREDGEEMVITNIRATDVSCGLRRIPAGFYITICHSDLKWKTKNKCITVKYDGVEWNGPIPMPSDPSATVDIGVHASFELQPTLGDGELLRELTITVGELVERSTHGLPFTFLPNDGDVVSPCSSLSVTLAPRGCNQNSVLKGIGSATTKPHGPLEDATNQGHSALSRYHKYGERHDLEYSIGEFQRALNHCPPDHPCLAAAESNMAMARFIQCHSFGDADASLEISLTLYRDALSYRPVGHPDRPSTLIQLAAVHFVQSEKQQYQTDVAEAIALLREAKGLSSGESYEHQAAAFMLQGYGATTRSVLRAHSEEWRTLIFPPNVHPLVFSGLLLHQFKRSGNIRTLQDVILILEGFLPSALGEERLIGLSNIGIAYLDRFRCFGKVNDLERAVSGSKEAAHLTPNGHVEKPRRLSNLGNSFLTRFERFGDVDDLEDGISSFKNAIELTSNGHPEKLSFLMNLGNSLVTRFQCLGDVGDLQEAILRQTDAADLTPNDHPEKAVRLMSLGNTFQIRFKRFGDGGDLESAIRRQNDAVELTPDRHPDKPGRLSNLGLSTKVRFEHYGDISNLENAIALQTQAVELTPNDRPFKQGFLTNLGNALLTRFEHLGNVSDLENAIMRLRDAVEVTPDGHSDKATHLSNVGNALLARLEQFGDVGDLENAIESLRAAIELTPNGHSSKPSRLMNLGDSFRIRFERLGGVDDLENAITTLRDATELFAEGHPGKPQCLTSLAISFGDRFLRSGDVSDLENAILTQRSAVELTPNDHPDKPGRLMNLGNSFLVRFKRFGEFGDLKDAIRMQSCAVELTPDGHPGKPSCLVNLGHSFHTHFVHLGDASALENAIAVYSRATRALTGHPSTRFLASRRWISCAHISNHTSLLDAYSSAIDLLPQIAWIGSSLEHRSRGLVAGADVAREAAAAALDSGRPGTAVEWLEQGRSIIWGELFQLRSPYEELEVAYPDHARRLRQLSAELDHAGVTREKAMSMKFEHPHEGKYVLTKTLEQEAHKHRALAIQRDELLQEIRKLPGFQRFLLRKQFSQLRAVAHSGPVVILNAAKSRCDALIVLAELDYPIHVPLSNVTAPLLGELHTSLKRILGESGRSRNLSDLDQMILNLQDSFDDFLDNVHQSGAEKCSFADPNLDAWKHILTTLWKSLVKPILDALALSTARQNLSRIFWCPTGLFTFLPIHAAGLYDEQYSELGNKIFDFVVSSYVPSLGVLTPARIVKDVFNRDVHFLSVRQPTSDGLPPLPGVNEELEHIKTIIRNSHSTQTTLLESESGTVEEVLELMGKADWVHFACHGIQDNENPTHSGLCLANERRLKISDIMGLSRLGGLAFLSACETAKGFEDLSDEAIHIAAGMLFAGYGSVLATMWNISDTIAPRVAEDVYEQLFRGTTRPDPREAARALHYAIGRVRDSGASFRAWVPFIHVGL